MKKAVLEAKSVAYPSGPSGPYIAELFKRMGIAEQVKNKLKLPPSNVPSVRSWRAARPISASSR